MVWQYINFPTLTTWKKGLLLTVIRIQGTAEARRCGAVAVRSQVITWSSTLTLYALYLSRPLPPSPSYQLRPFFLRLGRLSPPSLLLHVVYRGVPKQFPWTKVLGIQLLKNLSSLLFLCRLAPVHFRNTLCQKMHSLLHQLPTRESFSRSFSPLQFSHSSLINANYLCRRTFWNLPVNPVWRVPGFMEGGGGTDNEHSNPVLLPLVPEFTNIWISHLQFLHFQKFLLEVVAIGRKNAG